MNEMPTGTGTVHLGASIRWGAPYARVVVFTMDMLKPGSASKQKCRRNSLPLGNKYKPTKYVQSRSVT